MGRRVCAQAQIPILLTAPAKIGCLAVGQFAHTSWYEKKVYQLLYIFIRIFSFFYLFHNVGENIQPKYEALPLEPIVENKMATNCYWAKLDIKDLQKEDARMYTLLVESEKGRDSTSIKLIVKDSTEMRMTAAGVAVGLLILLALISISVYSLLRIRRRRYRQKIVEEGSIAADALYGNGATIDRQKSVNLSHVQTIARKPSLDSSQGTYDYSHIVKPKGAMSPEALKVRRAPVVLQPPTKV